MDTLIEMTALVRDAVSECKDLEQLHDHGGPITCSLRKVEHTKVTEYQFSFNYEGCRLSTMIREMDGPYIIFGTKLIIDHVTHPLHMVGGKVRSDLSSDIVNHVEDILSKLVTLVKRNNKQVNK